MPLYSMSCSKCLKIYEVGVKLPDYDKIETNDGPKCPHCDEVLKKLIDRPRFWIH
jgi:predicted nucleic acid-binding Zn ribbon protein